MLSYYTTLSLREPSSAGEIHVVVPNTALDLVCDLGSEVVAEITDQAEAAKFRLSRALLALLSKSVFLQNIISMKNVERDTGALPIQFTLLYGS